MTIRFNTIAMSPDKIERDALKAAKTFGYMEPALPSYVISKIKKVSPRKTRYEITF